MNRRIFLRNITIGMMSIAALPVAGSLEGCNSSVENILNTVLNSAKSILAVIPQAASWYQGFANAVSALENAEAQWTAGGAVTIVIDALNTLAAVTAVIPVTAPYAALIGILVAGITAVLTAIIPATPPASVAHTSASRGLARVSRNPHGGMTLQKPHFLQSRAGAYKEQFNATAITSGFPQAVIK